MVSLLYVRDSCFYLQSLHANLESASKPGHHFLFFYPSTLCILKTERTRAGICRVKFPLHFELLEKGNNAQLMCFELAKQEWILRSQNSGHEYAHLPKNITEWGQHPVSSLSFFTIILLINRSQVMGMTYLVITNLRTCHANWKTSLYLTLFLLHFSKVK